MTSQIDTVRQLVTDSIIRKDLIADPVAWNAICEAMDQVGDAPELTDKLTAVNVLRDRLGLSQVTAVSSTAELDDALSTVVDHLTALKAAAHQEFAQAPVPDTNSVTGLRYALEKLAEVTSGSGSAKAMASGGLAACRKHVTNVRDGMNTRGLDGTERVAEASYVLERVASYLEGNLDQPLPGDLNIMTSVALPALIEALDTLAREINVDDRKY